MTRHTRINTIISLLQKGPQTVESIAEHFRDEKVSARQIRTDIEAIKALGYGDDPAFEKTGMANRKTWQIKSSLYDRNTQRLNQGVLPRVFANKRQQSLEKQYHWLDEGHDTIIDSTHFYETEARIPLDDRLEVVIKAIDTNHKLRIINMIGDATSVTPLLETGMIVLPVRIIYHRGCFYLTAVTDDPHRVITLQIDQLTVQETNETFRRADWVNPVELDLKKRFGITQNIDDEVYKVELRFSSVTGDFVRRQSWHDEQDEPVRDGDDWLITFHCGINRELVGWLFQWMSNVQIIGPPKLKKLYNEQLARMQTVAAQSVDESLPYSNIFLSVDK